MTKSETTKNTETKEQGGDSSEPQAKTNTQTIVIAVLSTVLVCFVVVFAILLVTGVIKFGDGGNSNVIRDDSSSQRANKRGNRSDDPKPTDEGGAGTAKNGVTCYDDTRAQVGKLEFCLPSDFEQGSADKGVYTYNLVDDDGWAEVKVYNTKSSSSPTQYISKLSSNLKVTDQNYTVNGVTWVRAEASDNMLAFATKKNGAIYAVLLTVKLESDNTKSAREMIPETLTFVE